MCFKTCGAPRQLDTAAAVGLPRFGPTHGLRTTCTSTHGRSVHHGHPVQHVMPAPMAMGLRLSKEWVPACMADRCSSCGQTGHGVAGCSSSAVRTAAPRTRQPTLALPAAGAAHAAPSGTSAATQQGSHPKGPLGPAFQAGLVLDGVQGAKQPPGVEPTYIGSVFVVVESSDEDNLPQHRCGAVCVMQRRRHKHICLCPFAPTCRAESSLAWLVACSSINALPTCVFHHLALTTCFTSSCICLMCYNLWVPDCHASALLPCQLSLQG